MSWGACNDEGEGNSLCKEDLLFFIAEASASMAGVSGCGTWEEDMGRSKAYINCRINRFDWDSVAENPDKFRVVALAVGSNVTLLADQVKTFRPQLVAVRNESLIGELKEALANVDYKPVIIPGVEGVIEVARHPDAVTVIIGIVVCACLKPTVAAIEAGKDTALTNKETNCRRSICASPCPEAQCEDSPS